MRILKMYLDPAMPGNDGAAPADLPNLDTNPLMKAIDDVNGGAGGPGGLKDIDAILDAHQGTPPPAGANPPASAPPASADYIQGTFEHFKKNFGEGYEVPKDVTAENYLDKVYETLMPAFQKSISPQAMHLHNFLSKGGS